MVVFISSPVAWFDIVTLAIILLYISWCVDKGTSVAWL